MGRPGIYGASGAMRSGLLLFAAATCVLRHASRPLRSSSEATDPTAPQLMDDLMREMALSVGHLPSPIMLAGVERTRIFAASCC